MRKLPLIAVVAVAATVLVSIPVTRTKAFAARQRLLEAKWHGSLPVSWITAARMVATPSSQWPPLHLATLKRTSNGPCPYLMSTRIGEFWSVEEDGGFLLTLYEQLIDIYERYGVSVHPGDVVLDIGAYRGTFARHALESGARVVVAFEPQPENYACLEQTFAPEIARGAVRLVKTAIWDEAGTLQFAGAGLTGHVGGATDKSITVAATTIDDAVRDLGLDRVDFIKMDIEGAERHAVRGASQTLAKFQPRMALCVYHLPDDPKLIPALVLERQPKYRAREFAGEQTYFW